MIRRAISFTILAVAGFSYGMIAASVSGDAWSWLAYYAGGIMFAVAVFVAYLLVAPTSLCDLRKTFGPKYRYVLLAAKYGGYAIPHAMERLHA